MMQFWFQMPFIKALKKKSLMIIVFKKTGGNCKKEVLGTLISMFGVLICIGTFLINVAY